MLLPSVVLFLCITTILAKTTPIQYDQAVAADNVRTQRQAGGHDHHDAVDFGAHKGDHGSFGWYADFPVHGH
ncbi:hypothetical protein HHI36_015476 [Cryptolaemus montrouzieri]|uniref:Secreted protein n=1 Tax=Cryptolaemus montrouzieri TaxID=559131 RepID=A0ABD2N660_9CUCU